MNSRERVLTVFEHQEPDRVPCWCGSSVEFWAKAKAELNLDDEGLLVRFGDDFRRFFAEYAGPEFAIEEDSTYRTIFGVERMGYGYGQPKSHPLAEASLKEVNDYAWPDPKDMDVSKIKAAVEKYNGEYAILGGDWSPFWHDMIDLLGMENMYIKMHTAPEIIDAVLKHMVDYYIAVCQRIFDAAGDVIDISFIGNDFGCQTGPLMGPDMFKRFMVPHLCRFADLAHSYNLKLQMHCCGGVAELVPLMIEAGIDALHAVQPNCRGMDLKALKKNFGDKMVFNGAIDSNTILIRGTKDYTVEQTRKVLDIMMPGGGFIAGASHDSILEETPVENIVAMFDTVREYGVYK